MAAIDRPTEATYEIHENVTVDTNDHEDHTFCGIMFPVKCKDLLPLHHVVINSLAVRGRLGPLTVWVSNEDDCAAEDNDSVRHSFRMKKKYWTKLCEETYPPSFRDYQELSLRHNPIILKPGQVRAVYIHSSLSGDEAIVYDNRHGRRTHDDAFVSILPGRAHVSERAFSPTPIWGWGNAWRDNREFVGRIEYGVVYKLWNPMTATRFGSQFQTLVKTLFLSQRRWESPFSMLPDDCIFYIVNMCRWDWASDNMDEMKELKKRRKLRLQEAAVAEAATATATDGATMADEATTANSVAKTAAISICDKVPCRNSHTGMGEAAEETEDNSEEVVCQWRLQQENQAESEDEDGQQEMVEESEAGEGEEDDDSHEWDSEDDSHHAANDVFVFHDENSDDEEPRDEENAYDRERRAWIRRQFARIHVLRTLADAEGNGVMELDF